MKTYKTSHIVKDATRAYNKTKSGKEPHSHNGEDVHAPDFSTKERKGPRKSKSKSKSNGFSASKQDSQTRQIKDYADEHDIGFVKAKIRMKKAGLI